MARTKVLCLHGSQQDAEIFSQRIKKLTQRLADIVDFTFLDAPHQLPLQEGQEIRMRTWWTTSLTKAANQPQSSSNDNSTSWLEDNIVSEWKESLLKLEWTWDSHGGFDGILGFSKGAAAAFLFAAHCLASPALCDGLKFVIVVGGYVPKPLSRLLPPSMVVASRQGNAALAAPLKVPSLHIMGLEDEVVTMAESTELTHLYMGRHRQIIVHEKNHIVPQQSRYIQAIRDFITQGTFYGAAQIPVQIKPKEQSGTSRLAQPEADSHAAGTGTSRFTPPPLPAPMWLQPTTIEAPIPHDDSAAVEVLEEQQDELLSLEAIFMDEYRLISYAPPKFSISLKEPGLEDDAEGPPSRLFSIITSLPPGYPQTEAPNIQVVGPLGASDPRRLQLKELLEQITSKNLESGCGSVFQVVEAAKEWIDTNLPANIQDMKPGGEAVPSAVALQDAPTTGSFSGITWWDNEEADARLVQQAIQEASSSKWRWPDPETSKNLSDQSDGYELAQRGRWDYVVGLVGKPSAGKSTFFNAVTDPIRDEDGARVGSFPFTTIEPNVGRGYVLVPDPAKALGLDLNNCHTSFGHAPAFDLGTIDDRYSNLECLKTWAVSTGWGSQVAWRRLPVTVKDVAGLVPGAYKGRGHGNTFLADLCDADVLVHVVDISGSTDKEGVVLRAGEGADPLDDIGWVREELHRWIYDNVRSKWSTILRKPNRLTGLFSGYRASRTLVETVLQRIGITPGSLNVEGASLAHWGEADLHRLVAYFLQTRFPMLLACNKADLGTSEAHLLRVRQLLPHEPIVAVSAASERWLCQQRRAQHLAYQDGANTAEVRLDFMEIGMGPRFDTIRRNVLSRYGGTGAAAAISAAVALRPPRIAFPVADLDTFVALPAPARVSGGGLLRAGADAKARAHSTGVPQLLRDAVFLKPGSTVEDLYQVLTKPPYQLLEGDYVRAECCLIKPTANSLAGTQTGRSESGAKSRVLKKDEMVQWDNCVVRMATNRKSHWQHKAA